MKKTKNPSRENQSKKKIEKENKIIQADILTTENPQDAESDDKKLLSEIETTIDDSHVETNTIDEAQPNPTGQTKQRRTTISSGVNDGWYS